MLGFAPIRGLCIPARDSQTWGTVSTAVRAPHGTLLEHSTPGWAMMRQHLGKQGTALNFKVASDFPGRRGVQLVWKPRSCGVRVCSVVQGHGIARSPQGAAIAAPRREGSGGLLLLEELSTHRISQKVAKSFTEPQPNGVSGPQAQARASSTPTAPSNGWNASSVNWLTLVA
jgi:hypothetical protein